MSDQRERGITWTDATWNPIRGCSRVSEGCRNCYAERQAFRYSGPGMAYEGLVRVNHVGIRQPQWNGTVRVVEEHMLDPLRWKRPRRIFVNSMSDLFHENVADETIDRIFAVMALCPQHTFQVLTKRPERMLKYLSSSDRASVLMDEQIDMADWNYSDRETSRITDRALRKVGEKTDCGYSPMTNKEHTYIYMPKIDVWPLANVWLGVSVEDQKTADERIPLLLQTPAAVRWISAEPLLGPIVIPEYAWLPRAVRSDLPFPPFLVARPGLHKITRNRHGAASTEVDGKPLGLKPDEFEVWELDWVVVGGESGPHARPMHPEWARSLRDQCVAAGVAFHFKQWGEWLPGMCDGARWDGREGAQHINASDEAVRVGKRAAGRLLDGRTWDEYPAVRA